MLCDTCRNYPRHIEEFEGLREISLSLSCPEAARILLSQKEKVHFVTIEKEAAEETYDDFDYLIVMDQENIRGLGRIIKQDPENKIYKLLDFAGQDRDIADPWYTGDFDDTYEDILIGLEGLMRFLEKKA